MIRLNVILAIEKKSQAEFFRTVNHLVEKSKKEAGCIFYDFFQSTTDSELFMFCETWESEDALSKHKETVFQKTSRYCYRLARLLVKTRSTFKR